MKIDKSIIYLTILVATSILGLYFVSEDGTNKYIKSLGFVLIVISMIGVVLLKKKELNERKTIQIKTNQKISLIILLVGIVFLIFPSYKKIFGILGPLLILLTFYIDRKDRRSQTHNQ